MKAKLFLPDWRDDLHTSWRKQENHQCLLFESRQKALNFVCEKHYQPEASNSAGASWQIVPLPSAEQQ
ncbi:MAG: hypothetical protein FRX49_03325 [Trebouxia sp. A1-2]|nr:MAG: hypothetical protein FRX49_03325 [Trebouxia sp. A1-2]